MLLGEALASHRTFTSNTSYKEVASGWHTRESLHAVRCLLEDLLASPRSWESGKRVRTFGRTTPGHSRLNLETE